MSDNKGRPDPLERDLGKGRELASLGQQQALSARLAEQWKLDARAWVGALPAEQEFSADDLIGAVALPSEGPNNNNAVGAVFVAMARLGAIEYTGRTTPSVRTVRHGNHIKVWRRTGKAYDAPAPLEPRVHPQEQLVLV